MVIENELKEIRRDLHRIPELGFNVHKTANYIEEKLKEYGISSIERILETGIVAIIKGENSNEKICFRSDMDALPIQEPEKEYSSCHGGAMHACGHDGHMAVLLGFAKKIMTLEKKIPNDIVLLFQPAEEGPGGAEPIVKTGLFEKLNIKYVIGCHIFPNVDQGKVSCRVGGMMARSGEIYIDIVGKSAHGAMPELGADALLAAAGVISASHTIISRNISPLEGGVLTIGKIVGGDVCNVIAGGVRLEGTIRAFSDKTYEDIVCNLRNVVENISKGYGCVGKLEVNNFYMVVNNDKYLVNALQEVMGDDYEESPPYMLAEDFSFYQKVVDGIFFFLGSKNIEKGFVAPLHNEKFDFDEEILIKGVDTYFKLYEKITS